MDIIKNIKRFHDEHSKSKHIINTGFGAMSKRNGTPKARE
jgi:hypothetical protein